MLWNACIHCYRNVSIHVNTLSSDGRSLQGWPNALKCLYKGLLVLKCLCVTGMSKKNQTMSIDDQLNKRG